MLQTPPPPPPPPPAASGGPEQFHACPSLRPDPPRWRLRRVRSVRAGYRPPRSRSRRRRQPGGSGG
eukprot:11676797-Alexandrium_andersonii.AAC.1